MPTYIYETIPKNAKAKPRRFEVDQRMSAPALTKDPETDEPVRRVITGGIGFIGASDKTSGDSGPSGMGPCGMEGDCGMADDCPAMGGGGHTCHPGCQH
jgi:predicted nucleic acid-binding Zn ribbon protein